MQDAEPFDHVVRHIGMKIIGQRLPVRQHRRRARTGAHQPDRGRVRDADRRDAGLAHAGQARQRGGIGGEHAGQPAELAQQCLGERLGILPRDRQREQIFEQFVVEQPLGIGQQPRAQPGAVPLRIQRARLVVGHERRGRSVRRATQLHGPRALPYDGETMSEAGQQPTGRA